MTSVIRATSLIVALFALVGTTPRQTTTVTLRVRVVDALLRPVTRLAAGDFTVAIDGQPVAVQAMSDAPVPLALAVLVDASRSMPIPTGGKARTAFEKAFTDSVIGKLAPGDRARMTGLRSASGTPAAFTSDRRQLEAAFFSTLEQPASLTAGPSPIWDAVWEAATTLAREKGRRAIVLVSDGRGTGNEHGVLETIRHVLLAHTSVNVVFEPGRNATLVPQHRTAAAAVRPSAFLQQMADETGGSFFATQPPVVLNGRVLDLGLLLEHILDELRQQYELSIPLPADARFHRVQVTVTAPQHTVRAPKVIFAGQ